MLTSSPSAHRTLFGMPEHLKIRFKGTGRLLNGTLDVTTPHGSGLGFDTCAHTCIPDTWLQSPRNQEEANG